MQFFFFLLQLAVLIAIGVWLSQQPGAVTVTWRDWRLDTPIGVAGVGLAALVFLAALVYRLWSDFRRLPRRAAVARAGGRERRGYNALSQSLLSLDAGDVASARRQAERALRLLGDSAAARLVLARVAEQQGDETASHKHLEAMLEDDDASLAAFRRLVASERDAGRLEEAVRMAREVRTRRPKATWMLPELFALEAEAGLWQDADMTMKEAIRRRAVPRAEGSRSRAVILVERARAAEAEGDARSASRLFGEALKLCSDFPVAAIARARLLLSEGKAGQARRLLERAWARRGHPDLAAAYAGMAGDDALAQLQRLQRLHASAPTRFEGRLAIAEAAIQADLWGIARSNLAEAAREKTTARLCRLMASLEDDAEGSRTWLAKAIEAEADECWVCGECGAQAEEWAARCGSCNAFDAIGWAPPPRSLPALAASTAVAEAEAPVAAAD